jgi:hypothetical protein
MYEHLRTFLARLRVRGRAARQRTLTTLRRGWEARRSRDLRIPIEVLVADGSRRRKIQSELRSGLRRLQRILGDPPPGRIAIVVQQVIVTDRQLAGCCQLGSRPDGTSHALWRLALEVNHQALSSDELLAVLAEQWFALAGQFGSSVVLIPVDLEPGGGSAVKHPPTLPPDPLAAYSGTVNSHRA